MRIHSGLVAAHDRLARMRLVERSDALTCSKDMIPSRAKLQTLVVIHGLQTIHWARECAAETSQAHHGSATHLNNRAISSSASIDVRGKIMCPRLVHGNHTSFCQATKFIFSLTPDIVLFVEPGLAYTIYSLHASHHLLPRYLSEERHGQNMYRRPLR